MADVPDNIVMQLVASAARLEEKIEGVKDDIAEMKENAKVQQAQTDLSRGELHSKIDDVSEKLRVVENTAILSGQVAAQTRDLVNAKVIPVVEKVRGWEQRWGLLLTVATILGAGVWWLVQSNIERIWQFIRQF